MRASSRKVVEQMTMVLYMGFFPIYKTMVLYVGGLMFMKYWYLEKDSLQMSHTQHTFLALLCATAQQNYCCHMVIRHPSIKPIFSETVK